MYIRSACRLAAVWGGAAVAVLVAAGIAMAEIGDLSADSVMGQATFTDSVAQVIGPHTFGKPVGIAIDRVRNRLYVSDSVNHRVLGWSNASGLANGAPADLVIGQPDFISYGCNRSFDGSPKPATMDSLCGPEGLAVDSAGNLYAVDSNNCRVLEYDDPYANDTTADRALGQADGSCNGTIVNASRLYFPQGVAIDGADNVYVADYGSSRVLEYDGPIAGTDTVADRVYGQSNFTSSTVSLGGLYYPKSLSIDPSGRLFVGTIALMYEFDDPLGGAATHPQADHTLGSYGCNGGAESAASTCSAIGVATDSAGRLYLADAGNSRVLEFDSPLTVNQATLVFGQSSFGAAPGTTFCGNEACNAGGASEATLCLVNYSGPESSCGVKWAVAVAVDGDDNLWVADGFNNRVLRYDSPRFSDRAADLVLGQQSMIDTSGPVFPLDGPSAGVNDTSHFMALAIDTNNSRIAVYEDLGKLTGTPPIAILGQPDVSSTGCNSNGVSARSLCNPTAALVYNDYLWIADTGNNRVLRFDPQWLVWDFMSRQYLLRQDADFVFGQPDFTSTTCRAGADGVCAPRGLAIDAHGNLYVSDSGNNRILVDQNPFTADKLAEGVRGQPDFDSTSCSEGAGGAAALCDPRGIAVRSRIDPFGVDQGDDLYIADRGNNRVVLYHDVVTKPAAAGADAVFGQGGDLNAGGCGLGADALCRPNGVALDRRGNLLVADTDNNRVLEYDDPLSDTTADRVFGQAGFADNACNGGGVKPTATSLCQPANVVASGAYEGNVFVGDAGNNRVLRYQAPYCIESLSLTAANARAPGVRSKPTRTRLTITRGPGAGDDTVQFGDHLLLLEGDGSVYENDPPLFTLAADGSFADALFNESVPPWISNVRSTPNGGIWSTGDLETDHGITYYKIKERFFIPPGFGDGPQRDRLGYKAKAVGEDFSAFSTSAPWFRAQFGSTCFITELKCRDSGSSTQCKPAPPQ